MAVFFFLLECTETHTHIHIYIHIQYTHTATVIESNIYQHLTNL